MGSVSLVCDRSHFVHRLSDHVHDAAEHFLAHGHGNRLAGVVDLHAAHEAVGGRHGHRTHPVLAEVQRDLKRQMGLGRAEVLVLRPDRS